VLDFLTLKPEADTLLMRAGMGSFGENQQAVLGSLVEKHWSEVVAGDRDFSTGFIADRDYRTEDASTDTRLLSPLGSTELLFAGDDRAFGAAQFYGNYNSWERTKGWLAGVTQQFDSIAVTLIFTSLNAINPTAIRTSISTTALRDRFATGTRYSRTRRC
jgi:vitamin B12 transporter